MKITTANINNFIKKYDPNIKAILLYGQDKGLCLEYSKTITNSFFTYYKTEEQIINIDINDLKKYPEKLSEEAFSISLLGSANKIINIKDASASITPIIKDYINSPDEFTLLVLEAEELPANNSLRKLFETNKNSAIIACYHDNATSLRNLILQTLKTHNFSIETNALNLLISNLGNDRSITKMELEKLMLFKYGNNNITLEDIHKIIVNNSESALDKVIYNVFSGNAKQAYIGMYNVLEEIICIVIVRSMINHMKKLLNAQILINSGVNINEVTSKMSPPILFMYIEQFKQQLHFWNIKRINIYIAKLLKLEFDVKNNSNLASTFIKNFVLETINFINK